MMFDAREKADNVFQEILAQMMEARMIVKTLSTRIRELERVENSSDESTNVLKVQIFS